MLVAVMVLGFVAMAVMAVAWILVDDRRKRRNARKMRPRDRETVAPAVASRSGGIQPAADAMAFMRRSSASDEEAAGASDLSQGAA
jgi:Flp pilus assembly protein TadB